MISAPDGRLQVTGTESGLAIIALNERRRIDSVYIGYEFNRLLPRKTTIIIVTPVVMKSGRSSRNHQFKISLCSEVALDKESAAPLSALGQKTVDDHSI